MKIRVLILFVAILASVKIASSQKVLRTNIREGNQNYFDNKYTNAEVNFKKALEVDKSNLKAKYNLSNALYKQQKFSESQKILDEIKDMAPDSATNSMIYHNLGNNFLQQKKYAEAATAYKKALKYNHNDQDSRYNLAYAQKMLRKEQESEKKNEDKNQDQKQDQNQNKQDKNQSKQDQNKGQNKDDKKDDGKDDKSDSSEKDGKKDEQKKDGKPEPAKLSKQDADKMMKSVQEKDLKTKQKADKVLVPVKKVKTEKDW